MVTKSLLMFRHTSVGTLTHKPRTATAHVSYIMRAGAMTKFQAENMPGGGYGTRVFFDKLWEKAGMPEKYRICDKFMLALPRELSPEQRHEAVGSFMHGLGQGRIAWCAAHHDRGEDSHNPHAHIAFKDADIDTGRKVIGTTISAKNVREALEHGWKVPPRATTEDLRKRWSAHLNAFMERAGLDIRYDPRTLKEQGIGREPQIHIGPKAQALAEKDYAFTSRDALRGDHSVPYTVLDEGSRVEHNNRIIARNKERAANSSPKTEASSTFIGRETLLSPGPQDDSALQEKQAKARQALYAEQKLDREALRKAQGAERLDHMSWGRRLYADARQAAFETIKEQYGVRWNELRANTPSSQRKEAAAALKAEQKAAYAEEAKRRIDGVRPEKDAAWKALQDAQEKERLALQAEHREETAVLTRQHVAERLASYEEWRAQALDKREQPVGVTLSGPQSLAAREPAARAMRGLLAKTHALTGVGEMTVTPRDAGKAYRQIAEAEEAKRTPLREALLKMRTKNLDRAAQAAFRERMQAAPFLKPERAKAGPRQIMLPGILDARKGKAAAPRDIRQRLSDRELRALALRDLPGTESGRDPRGTSRNGGGRGRSQTRGKGRQSPASSAFRAVSRRFLPARASPRPQGGKFEKREWRFQIARSQPGRSPVAIYLYAAIPSGISSAGPPNANPRIVAAGRLAQPQGYELARHGPAPEPGPHLAMRSGRRNAGRLSRRDCVFAFGERRRQARLRPN